jgi:hypothetical protein
MDNKNPYHSFRGEVKPLVPCHRFMAYERTQQSMSEMLCQQYFANPVSPALLLDGFVLRW